MITRKNVAIATIALGVLGAVSCSSDDDDSNRVVSPPVVETADFSLSFKKIDSLTMGATFEGWIIVDGVPVSTGKFNKSSSGLGDEDFTFTTEKENLLKATKFVVSIEPNGDNDDIPSDVKILSGDFDGTDASISLKNEVADFSTSEGEFILATPTDNEDTNETNGVWFMTDLENPEVGLTLPTLPTGWKYEGWVVFDGVPVSTGVFTSVETRDENSPYSLDINDAPMFPGEDFLSGSFNALMFPEDGDVSRKNVVISIEPNPDFDRAAPFFYKPLSGAAGAIANRVTPLGFNGSGATGLVIRPAAGE